MAENSEKNECRKGWTGCGFVFRLVISCLILGFAVSGAILLGSAKAPEQKMGTPQIIPTVQIEEIFEQKDGLTFKIDGTVVPFREVPIASEVSGKIAFLSPQCRVGRYVQKGEVLMKIDPTDYELELAQAQQEVIQAARSVEELAVNITNARAELEIAQKQQEVQQREVQRVQGLAKNGAISQTELDSTLLTALEKRDAVQTLMNQIRTYETQRERLVASRTLAEVQVRKAKVNLERCTIHAPLDGVVVELQVEEDKFVQRGESLVSIHDTSRLEVQCSLYMKHVEWLWSTRAGEEVPGGKDVRNYYQFRPTPVTIVYRLGNTEYAWKGTLEYLDGPGLDARTRMLPCRVVVQDPLDVQAIQTGDEGFQATPSLLPGMFVEVRVHVVPRCTLLNMSEMAILPGGTVWKVVDGRMKRIQITTAQSENGRVLVYAKPGVMEAGDRVIVSPLASPLEDAQVEVVQ